MKFLVKNPTFRVTVKRLTKTIPQKSDEFARDVGAIVVEKTGLGVNLTNYDIEISVEIIDDYAYIFYDRIKGLGGLPVGTSGKVLLHVEETDGAVVVTEDTAEDIVRVAGVNSEKIKFEKFLTKFGNFPFW